jgi:16S rRNA processing protein RimM
VSGSSLLELGYIARAHSLKGEVGLRTFDPGSQTLDSVERVLVRTRSGEERVLKVEGVRPTPKENLVSFEGVDSREAAEALVGSTVLVYREDLEPPAEGEYFLGDLMGLSAVDEAGNALGKVVEIWETGEVPNLVIRGGKGAELVVPFADEFVPTVELEAGRIVIRPPEYIEAVPESPEAMASDDTAPDAKDGEEEGS